MKPPNPSGGFGREVAHIILNRPGISFGELQVASGLFQQETIAAAKALLATGIAEYQDGGFRIRERRRKPKPKPAR